MSASVRLEVNSAGWLTTFQDLGRKDAEKLGVPTGGAADQHSATVANLLVGNARGATLIESMGGQFAFTPSQDILVAVTGTPAQVTVDDAHVDQWSPVVVPAGHEIRVRESHLGTRSYLAISGAIEAESFLGSAAPDARMGFPQTVTAGASIRVLSTFYGFNQPHFDQYLFRLPVPIPHFEDGPWTIDVVESAQTSGIPGFRDLLESSTYSVTDRSNHVGLRLDGPVLHPREGAEIVSHGVPIGAVEIPHADELILLGRYRSLTAGYPIVGFASRASLALLGQAGPGRQLRFAWVDRKTSVRNFAHRESQLHTLEHAVTDAFAAVGLTTPAHAQFRS